jgi:hypothetical protein
VSDEHGHANHHGDADDDDRDKESTHRLSSNGAARSLRLPNRFYICGALIDARQHHHDEDARGCAPTLPIIAAATTPSLLVARQNVLAVESFASRCLQQAKAPPGESGAFWGSKDWGDRPASEIGLSMPEKGSKQQRRQSGVCSLGGVAVETGYAIPQYQYVGAAWKRFNGPKGLRGGGANSRRTCRNEKTRP